VDCIKALPFEEGWEGCKKKPPPFDEGYEPYTHEKT